MNFKMGFKWIQQTQVQDEIDLHKPRKIMISANWSQMVHKQTMNNLTHKTHHNMDSKGVQQFPPYNILYKLTTKIATKC